jgi:Zn-dependent peptidase ImmA (M78 family)/DNA-binding XRE family transcriptional regulator
LYSIYIFDKIKSNNMKPINPTRLRDLRKHSKLSQSNLARRLGLDSSMISRWEKGERQPSLEQCFALARAFGVSVDYLLHAKENINFQFRSKKTLNSEEKSVIERTLVNAEQQIHYLHTAYEISEKIPPPFLLNVSFSYEHLKQIGRQIRDTLKLNLRITFDELKQALAENNVHVFQWSLPKDMSGLSYRDSLAVIFINRNHSKERRLFTLAHEFAHLLFHLGRDSQQTMVSVISSYREPEEKQANTFASELLMPDDVFVGIVNKFGDKVRQLEVMDFIAQLFNVSREAVFYRLAEKEIIKWMEKQKYFRKPKDIETALDIRVHDINEDVSSEFLNMALELYYSEKISAGKLCEWLFTEKEGMDIYLARRKMTDEEILEF